MSEADRSADAAVGVVYSLVEEYDGGGELVVRYRRGPDPLVVFMHGWGRSHADFQPLLASEHHAAVTLDLPGFGRSTPPSQPTGARGYAELLVEPLTRLRLRLGAERVVLVGHSFGGRVAAELVGIDPAQLCVVGALIIASPLLRPAAKRRVAPGYLLVRALHRAHLVPAWGLEWARQRWGSADYRAASGVMREVLVRTVNEQHLAPLRASRVPIELLWGSDDSAAPVELAEKVAERVPLAHLEVLPGVGHDVPRLAPQAVQAALERLLRRADAARDGGARA